MKNWKTRLKDTWASIDKDYGAKVPQKVQALKGYHDQLTDRQKKAVSEAMGQGAYPEEMKKAEKPMEKAMRVYRRQMILVLMAKAGTGNPDTDLQRAQAALDQSKVGNQAVGRVELELVNLPEIVGMMKQRGSVDDAWDGWDGRRQRPLLAGCAVGRRGSQGPGTLGCFVRRGNDIFILSNRHVLRQDGKAADDEIIQPPHGLGGTYYDNIATFEDELVSHDAAIAKVHPGIQCMNRTPEGTTIQGSAVAAHNGAVTKEGCATRQRHGTVINVNSRDVPTAQGQLQDQLLIERDDALDAHGGRTFQVQGDSGSVVLDHQNRVVALLHGQGTASQGQATHITPILTHFNVTILPPGVHIAQQGRGNLVNFRTKSLDALGAGGAIKHVLVWDSSTGEKDDLTHIFVRERVAWPAPDQKCVPYIIDPAPLENYHVVGVHYGVGNNATTNGRVCQGDDTHSLMGPWKPNFDTYNDATPMSLVFQQRYEYSDDNKLTWHEIPNSAYRVTRTIERQGEQIKASIRKVADVGNTQNDDCANAMMFPAR